MTKFTITTSKTIVKTWKVTGINRVQEKKKTIQAGQEVTAIGKKNPSSERSFDARHKTAGITPKNTSIIAVTNKAKIGSTANLSDKLFKTKK